MPSQLPTTDSTSRKVKDFGVGTYDSPIQSEYNEEGDFEFHGESLPTRRDPRDLKGDDLIGGPDVPVSEVGKLGSSDLPGDLDRPPRQKKKPEDSTITSPIESVAQSALPTDKNNPPARSDYYDKTKIGDTMLPGSINNDQSLDRFLESLGNWWSGWTETDVAQPMSFPKVDRPPEETDKYTSVPMGTASTGNHVMNRQATNLDLVGTLTSEFLKKHGKKGLTRRHVMAFLRVGGYHQYLASDIVRCLQQRHNIHVADVLDQFPISDVKSKTASVGMKADIVKNLVEIRKGIASIDSDDRHASESLKTCGDNIMKIVAEMVRGLEDG